MHKLPECDRCQFYARSSYTVCAVHPYGIEEKRCLDFREDPKAEPQELWEPENVRYIDDNLVLERSYYNGEEIAPPQRVCITHIVCYFFPLEAEKSSAQLLKKWKPAFCSQNHVR